jgi:hypothetical protein
MMGLLRLFLLAGFALVPSMHADQRRVVTSSAKPTVPFVLTCAGKLVQRPTSYVVACADANIYFRSLHWRSWGATRAVATGTLVQNNCVPNCAAGKFLTYPARLELYRPKATALGLLFSALHYTYTVAVSTTLPLRRL